MTTARRTPQTPAARHQAQLRQSYRQHRVKVNGKWYNPVLDDPNHPNNPRHWTHGTLDGYQQAGCGCPPCAEASRAEEERKRVVRLTNRLDSHRAAVTVLLAQLLDIDGPTAAAGADAVVGTHRVVSQFRGTVAYQDVAVRLALRDWGARPVRIMGLEELTHLSRQLVEKLNAQ